jgi:hypothetical protein
VRLAWADEVVTAWGVGATVTSRFTERVGSTEVSYRFLDVLRRDGRAWRLVAAQSTRLPVVRPALEVPESTLRDYVGRYGGEGGATFGVAVRDAALWITVPGGREDRLVPLAPAVFEIAEFGSQFAFERDATGRVVALVALTPQTVFRWPRVP